MDDKVFVSFLEDLLEKYTNLIKDNIAAQTKEINKKIYSLINKLCNNVKKCKTYRLKYKENLTS